VTLDPKESISRLRRKRPSKNPWGSFHLLGRFGIVCTALAAFFSLHMALSPDLPAFTIIENKVFTEGPFQFKLEVQVYGRGSAKKLPMTVNSLKVKIKNEKRSTKPLEVMGVRAYLSPQVFQDIETKGYPIAPGQWVTKYYLLPKEKRPLLGKEGFVQVAFDGFTITFSPRERIFLGPLK
jgi:hypothetical protein